MTQTPNSIVGCEAVNKHISEPIPRILWHYSTYAGFQGIVASKRIWATEFRFLNDREEFLHAKELAQDLVELEPEFTGEVFPARDTLRKAVNIAFNTGHLHEERLRVMVASFTEEGDQLSQWRGYAGNSTGVSIGLDLTGLRPPADIGTTVTFAPCLYKRDEKAALLKAVFAHYRSALQGWWDSVVHAARKANPAGALDADLVQRLIAEHAKEQQEIMAHAHTTLQFDLLRTAPLLKNESFFEEREWRLVLPIEPIRLPTKHRMEFRPTREALIPYVAYPLHMPNQEGPVFCKDVVLGPGSHPSAVTGVNLFLQANEIPTLARLSQVPYRPA